MANRSFMNFGDELEDDDSKPYDSLSSRPVEGLSGGSRPSDSAIRDMILKRQAEDKLSNPLSTNPIPAVDAVSEFSNDPLMKDFNESQRKLDEYRKVKSEGDYISNMGQALAPLARGTAAPIENKALYASLQKQGQEGLEGQQDALSRRSKVIEAIEGRKAREGISSENRKLRQTEHQDKLADRALQREAMQSNKDAMLAEKHANAQKLSEKQFGEIQDFDNNLQTMKSVINQVGDHPEWTGPIDGRVPDAVIGSDQVAFRAELGRMVDQYRKLVTGAGASSEELKKLETRLPSPTDTHSNFMAKARNFVDSVERARGGFVKNLENQGKNTEPFKEGHEYQPQAKPKGNRPPGSLVKYQGKMYRVGADGDSLEEIG